MILPNYPKDPSIDYAKFGAFQAEYRPGSLLHKVCIVIALVATVAIAGAGVYIVMRDDPRDGDGGRIAAVLIFSVVASPFFLVFLLLIQALRVRVYLFTNGLLTKGIWRVQVVYWSDIKYLYEKVVIHSGMVSDQIVILRLESGQRIEFNGFFREIASLAETIRGQAMQAISSKSEERLRQHDFVPFGKLKLSSEGLDNSREQMAWHEVERIDIEEDAGAHWVVIRKAGQTGAWFKRAIPDFPNITLFLSLTERFLN